MDTPWVHIVGGGLAGLSLAREIARFPDLPGRVVISESRKDYTDDRTFSFWFYRDQKPFLKPQSVHRAWSIGDADSLRVMVGDSYHYGTRSVQSFYTEAMQIIAGHPQIEWRHESVQVAPTAQCVFDSRPPKPTHFKVTQSFHGIVAKTRHPHGIEHVSLMDDLKVTDHGIRFRYLIPLSDDHLLLEHTDFTSKATDFAVLRDANEAWLTRNFPQQWECIRTEQAHIPMGVKPIQEHFGIPIGTRGAMARDATGYSYVRTQYWAQRAATQLVRERNYDPYVPPAGERWMDRLLLKLIQERPDTVPQIFKRLAAHLEPDVFARFMMEHTLGDSLRVIFASPKKPFICALIGRCQWI
jgi:lycopene beta-cyclase